MALLVSGSGTGAALAGAGVATAATAGSQEKVLNTSYNVGPPKIAKLVYKPHENYSYLRTINHSYWSYKPT